MVLYCALPGCKTNSTGNNPLARFPENMTRKKQWIDFVRKEANGRPFIPNTASRLCHKHFDPECIIGKVLKSYAVPSIGNSNLSQLEPSQSTSKRQKRMELLEENSAGLIQKATDLERVLFNIRRERPHWHFERTTSEFLLYRLDMSHVPKIACGINFTADLQITVFNENRQLDLDLVAKGIDEELDTLSEVKLIKLCNYLESSEQQSNPEEIKFPDLLSPTSGGKLLENIQLQLSGEAEICRMCFSRQFETGTCTLKYISHDTRQYFHDLTQQSMNDIAELGNRICEACSKILIDAVKVKHAVLDAEQQLLLFHKHFPEIPPQFLPVSVSEWEKNESLLQKLNDNSMEELPMECDNDEDSFVDCDPNSDSDGSNENVNVKIERHSPVTERNISLENIEMEPSEDPDSPLEIDEPQDDISVKDEMDVGSWEFSAEDGYLISVNSQGKKEYHCTKCNKKYAKKYCLDYHFRRSSKHSAGTQVLDAGCDMCGSYFYDQATLKRHIAMVHDTLKTPCVTCGREFNAYHMVLHMKRHNKTEFSCKFCGKKFENNFLLQDHIRQKHTHETPFQCDVCTKAFSSKVILAHHIGKEHPNAPKPFLCTMCGQGFLSKQALASHQRFCSGPHSISKPKQYRKLSPKPYKTQELPKPYGCQTCSKRFAVKPQLEKHEAKHNNDAVHVCEECDMVFTRREALKNHTQMIHTKEFQYFCQFCNKGFVNSSSKKQHENSHTNAKLHYCKYCSCSFNRANALNTHINALHKNRRYRCRWCFGIGTIKEIRKFSTFLIHVKKFHEDEYDSDEDLNEQIIEDLLVETGSEPGTSTDQNQDNIIIIKPDIS